MQPNSPDSIGYIVWVLHFKLWGKIPVNGKLRSQQWWRSRLTDIINQPTIHIPPENLWDGKPAEPAPIRFEEEMGWSEDTARFWLQWLQTALRRLDRR